MSVVKAMQSSLLCVLLSELWAFLSSPWNQVQKLSHGRHRECTFDLCKVFSSTGGSSTTIDMDDIVKHSCICMGVSVLVSLKISMHEVTGIPFLELRILLKYT